MIQQALLNRYFAVRSEEELKPIHFATYCEICTQMSNDTMGEFQEISISNLSKSLRASRDTIKTALKMLSYANLLQYKKGGTDEMGKVLIERLNAEEDSLQTSYDGLFESTKNSLIIESRNSKLEDENKALLDEISKLKLQYKNLHEIGLQELDSDIMVSDLKFKCSALQDENETLIASLFRAKTAEPQPYPKLRGLMSLSVQKNTINALLSANQKLKNKVIETEANAQKNAMGVYQEKFEQAQKDIKETQEKYAHLSKIDYQTILNESEMQKEINKSLSQKIEELQTAGRNAQKYNRELMDEKEEVEKEANRLKEEAICLNEIISKLDENEEMMAYRKEIEDLKECLRMANEKSNNQDDLKELNQKLKIDLLNLKNGIYTNNSGENIPTAEAEKIEEQGREIRVLKREIGEISKQLEEKEAELTELKKAEVKTPKTAKTPAKKGYYLKDFLPDVEANLQQTEGRTKKDIELSELSQKMAIRIDGNETFKALFEKYCFNNRKKTDFEMLRKALSQIPQDILDVDLFQCLQSAVASKWQYIYYAKTEAKTKTNFQNKQEPGAYLKTNLT